MANSGAYLARKGVAKAIKSDYAKKKIKNVANKYLDQVLDSFASNLSKKISPTGGAIDIHKAILKVAPKKGFVMPGHRYTGPGNPLEQQLRYDPNTGQILEIYQQPTGRTDAVSMQHDVDYSVCGNKPKGDQVKCKNNADRKMVKALDAIPWKERQWGHTIARNAIAAKSKLGMGVKKPKNEKKPSSEENWQEKLADELHTPIKRNFTRRCVITNHIDEIWASDLVEMQQFSKWNKGYRYLLMTRISKR